MGGLTDVLSNLLVPKGVSSPAKLYEEAVPRAERIMQQYDTAAPLIDWVQKNPIATLGIALGLGALAVVGGNFVYGLITNR